MDFELTPEQREVQATVRQFVDERVLPNAIENDINHHLDMEAIAGMAELGLLGIVIPEEYGGAGLDFVSEALVCEEIERGEAAFRTLISVHVGLNSLTLLRYADEEQKQRYLTPQARGDKLGCFGLTEPAAGSDVAAMLTNARREGDNVHPQRPEELDLLRERRRPRARLREDRPGGEAQRDLGLHRRARVAGRDDR